MIGAVIVHNVKDWDFVMCCGPQRAGIEHEVAVATEATVKPPRFLLAKAAPIEAGKL
jgi:hypothetical protein